MLCTQVFWCFLLHLLDCKLHKFRVGNMFSGTLYFFYTFKLWSWNKKGDTYGCDIFSFTKFLCLAACDWNCSCKLVFMLHLCGSWSYPFLWGCDWWHLQKTSVFGSATLSICLWGLRSWDMSMVSFCCFEVLVLLVCCLEDWIEFASSNWHRTFSRISNVHHWFSCSVSFFSCPLAVSRFWEILLRVEEFFIVFPHAEILACLAFVPYPVLQWADNLQLSVRHQILHFMFKVFLSLNALWQLPIDFPANIRVSMLKVALDFWCIVSHPFPQAGYG